MRTCFVLKNCEATWDNFTVHIHEVLINILWMNQFENTTIITFKIYNYFDVYF